MASHGSAVSRACPYFIGVTGSSAWDRRYICRKIITGLNDKRCALVSLDSFYHGLPQATDIASRNFDHQNAFDFNALRHTLTEMGHRRPVNLPYDCTIHKRAADGSVEHGAADVIIVEGIMILHDESICDMLDVKIYVEEDAKTCLSRCAAIKIISHGSSEAVMNQYEKFVKPSFEEYNLPKRDFADLILTHGGKDAVAIYRMIMQIQRKIGQQEMGKVPAKRFQKTNRRDARTVRGRIVLKPGTVDKCHTQKRRGQSLAKVPNLVVVSESAQYKALETMMQRADINKDNMVLCCNLLVRILIEQALGMFPFERKIVRTITGAHIFKVDCMGKLVALNIQPHGSKMADTLREVCHDVSIANVQIDSGEKQVKLCNVPDDLRNRYVMVLAPILDNGKACRRTIEELMTSEFGCEENRIMVLSLLVTPEAAEEICSRYTNIRLVNSVVDKGPQSSGESAQRVVDFVRGFYRHK